MKLREIVPEISGALSRRIPSELADREITWVTSDSRDVKVGAAFVAIRGGTQDGHGYLKPALAQGAVLLIGEAPAVEGMDGAAYVQVRDSRLALAELAAAFYGHPSRSMRIVGVTGTSGKTTTTHLIESILKESGLDTGLIGTIEYRYRGQSVAASHTTPGAVELQKLLSEMRDAGCKAVVMEVSSHSLKQRRSYAIAFDGVVFTNLTSEHLDYHPDMEDYFRSKALLFTDCLEYSRANGKKPAMAISLDDEFGRRLYKELEGSSAGRTGFALSGPADLSGDELEVSVDGIRGRAGDVQIDSNFIAAFNAQNILASVAISRAMGIDAHSISRGIRALRNVPGRLERVANSREILVLVDYAHKPDALEKVLKTLRAMEGRGRIITVFGCGGDRDRTKRPIMGRIAAELSDEAIVTSDNPRTENPLSIIGEITTGMAGFSNFRIEPDRKKAIFRSIKSARTRDIVLIAGKGHEDYQIIGKTKIHFDDRAVAKEALDDA